MSAGQRPTCNIAATMEAQARIRPYQRAVVFPASRDRAGHVAWTHLTFQDLNRLTDEYARGFQALGIQRGDRVSLLVKPSLEFIPLTFALFKLGALPVLIDPGMGRAQLLACLQRMAPRVLVAIPLVQALRGFFPRAFRSVEISITAGRRTWYWGGRTLGSCRVAAPEPFPTVASAPDDDAAILFTSGSTGPAKGVRYTHGIFDAQTRFIQQMYDIGGGEVDLACFPLFGLFSMSMGMTVVIPDMDPSRPARVDPARLVEAIHTQGCTSAFGSPAIWTRLAPWCLERGIRLPSLRRVLIAGAPVPVSLHRAYQGILAPGVQLHTPYGATESLPVATIASQEVLSDTASQTERGAGTCVGWPAPGIAIRIIRVSDDPMETWTDALLLPQGEIGEITVTGPQVTREYVEDPVHTRASRIREGDHIVHRMGDLGYLDERGRLWFCGRKSHRVVTARGETLFPVPCEAIFNQHPDVFRTALVGVGAIPHLVVELQPGCQRDRGELERELLELGQAAAITRGIQHLHFHPGFPVDVRHNAKIHRLQLAAWVARRVR